MQCLFREAESGASSAGGRRVESHMFPVTGTLVTAPSRSHFGSIHLRDPLRLGTHSQRDTRPGRILVRQRGCVDIGIEGKRKGENMDDADGDDDEQKRNLAQFWTTLGSGWAHPIPLVFAGPGGTLRSTHPWRASL